VTLRDARALEPLRSAAKSPPHFLGIAHTKWMVAQLESAATALAAACEKLPADDETTKALAARQTRLRPLDKPKPVGDSQKLLEAVWAKPDDDAVRLVVADALLERNDPWGEFITLQFRIAAGKASAVDRKRAASLLRVNAQRFGGPIAHIATKNYWAFEKGFLVSCAADRSMVPSRRWKEAASAPHWATVRSVRLSTHAAQSWVTAWAANPALTSLRKVTFRSLELGRESATSPWRLTKANKKLEFAEVKYFRAFVAGLAPPARPKTSHPQLLE
jgi:uncharacterized protein (TIGR02996 family)